jgi:hypothetical protein
MPDHGLSSNIYVMDSVESASRIREALHRCFATTAFTVRSHRDGTAAFWPTVDVTWTGPPTEQEVRVVVDDFLGYRVEWSADADHSLILVPVSRQHIIGDTETTVSSTVVRIELHRY